MENLMLNSALLPNFLLHIEIVKKKDLDHYWPKVLSYRQLLIYQMPVTQALLNHLDEFEEKPVPKWMILAYPEAEKLLKERDPYRMVTKMDLAKIMRLENQLNPRAIPYPVTMWLKQIADAKLEFSNIVAKKDEIAYTFPGRYCNPTLILKMSPNFPFEPPLIEKNFFVTPIQLKWINNVTTLKLCCQRYTEHVNTYETIFEYISSLCLPGARVILVNDDGNPISKNNIKNLPIEQERYMTLFCKFLPPFVTGLDEFYAEVIINTEKFEHFPQKIDILPKNPNFQAKEKFWIKENTLENNLYDCIFKEQPLLE